MIAYSIIQKSQLESAHRMDSEYYQPEYLELADKISQLKLPKLKDLTVRVDTSAFYPSITDWYTNQGTAFVRVENILNFQLIEKDLLFLPQNIVNKFKSIRKGIPGDIVITKGGTVGNVAILPEKYPVYALSRDIILLKTSKLPRDKSVTILLFLGSKFGIFQLIRGASQQIQPHLTLSLIRNLLVPDKTVYEAIKFYDEALNKISISKSFYAQAEELLLEGLGLKDFEPEDELSYVVNLSDVRSAHRADGAYFQPKYHKILQTIEKRDVRSLGKIVSIKKGIEPGSGEYRDEGKAFIRVSNLSKYGIIEKNQKYFDDDFYQRLQRNFEPKIGEILLTKDATPGIAYVVREALEGIISGGILRLKLKEDIEAEYFALFINTIIGQMQIERDAGGSVIAHWKPEQIKKMEIPISPRPTQKKIADLVIQSHQARKMAKNLLEKAKREVERFVEAYSIKEK